jgi:hypothetical protein
VFGAGVTEIPGEELGVAITAVVDNGAGGTAGALGKEVAEIPDGSAALGAGVVAAGNDGACSAPSTASAMPLMATPARHAIRARRAVPFVKRSIMSSGTDSRR